MTDLDAALAETFERRAASAPASISTDAVRGAIRRRRNRTLKLSAALAVATLAAAGVLLNVTASRQQGAAGIGGDQGWKSAVGSFTPIVRLPAAGTTLVSVARIVQKTPPSTYYELCSGNECDAEVDLAGKAVTEQGHGGAVYGLAPPGTVKVVVSLAGAAYVQAELVEIPTPTHPLLYAAPGLSRNVGTSTLVTRTVRVVAVGASGKVTSAVEVLGSQELAERHPVAGPVIALPSGGADTIGAFAWLAADGWSCQGNRTSVDGRAVYGAVQCQRPRTETELSLVTSGQEIGPPGSGTVSSSQVLRAPSAVRTLIWQLPGGAAVPATVRATAQGVLAVLVVKSGDVSTTGATLTGTDTSGVVVLRTTEGQLSERATTPMPSQASGHGVPIHVSAP